MDKGEKIATDFMLEKTYKPIIMQILATCVMKMKIEVGQELEKVKRWPLSDIRNELASDNFKKNLILSLESFIKTKEDIAFTIMRNMSVEKTPKFQYMHTEIAKMYEKCTKLTIDLIKQGNYSQLYSYGEN